MNNRIIDFEPGLGRKPTSAAPGPAHETGMDLEETLAFAVQWVEQNPIPCLAAALVLGGAIGWIVKRR